ncbi:MAG: glycosyltransferase [Armatimonadetes bacterium]|nr:glycosyltransferase [Armatimonadota bacterium]
MIGIFLPPAALDVSKIKYALKIISIFDKQQYEGKIIIFVHRKDIELLQNHVNYIYIKEFGFSNIQRKIQKVRKILNFKSSIDYNITIEKYEVKFAIFLTPMNNIVHCSIPYAASFQSLGHRLNPELPETTKNGRWKLCEDASSAVCNNAKVIFIDSDVGKKYLDFYYHQKGKVFVVPHNSHEVLNIDVDKVTQRKILNKFNVSNDFLFYPAQFWPHKNHVRILEALIYLKGKSVDLQLVFTGSSKAIREEYNVEYMLKRIAKDSNMEKNLIITGYLEYNEMKTLYLNALAMIMPQLIPEPCIPIAEAMSLGCPVLTSKIPGLMDQVKDSGILVNPYDIESIANGIELLLDTKKRGILIKKGLEYYRSTEKSLDKIFLQIENRIISYLN